MKNHKGIIWAPILIIVATIVVAGVSGYLLFKAGNPKESENQNVVVVNQANNNSNTNIVTNTNQVANINASVNTNTTADLTAGWKTYTNTTFGYQMKYPADYLAKDASKGSTISKGALNGSPYYRVDVVVYVTPITGGREGQDIYTWAKNGFPRDANVEKEHANLRQVTLGGITYWASDGDLGSTPIPDFMVFHDNKLFVLTDYRVVDKTVDTNLTIISSFKFTDPTAGWKTYTNTTIGFTIKHPDGWRIDDTSTSNKVWFNPSGTENVDSIEVGTTTKTLDQLYEEADVAPGTKSRTTLGGQPAIRFDLAEFALTEIRCIYQGKLISINTNGDLKRDPVILSTFQFAN